jgi:hypothetical protein
MGDVKRRLVKLEKSARKPEALTIEVTENEIKWVKAGRVVYVVKVNGIDLREL